MGLPVTENDQTTVDLDRAPDENAVANEPPDGAEVAASPPRESVSTLNARRRIARDARGRVLPGSVLNPSGSRHATYWEIVRLARSHAPEAVQTLVEIMRAAPRDVDRVHAATELLNRGLGKAPQTVEVNVDSPAREMTDEALRLAAQEILSRLPAGAVIDLADDATPVSGTVLDVSPHNDKP